MIGWISIDHALPEDPTEFVLVSRNWGVQATMEANYIDGKFMSRRFGASQEFLNPTHWMPMPEPHK